MRFCTQKFTGVRIYLLTLIFSFDVLVTCVKQVWELDILFCVIKSITYTQLGDTLVKIIHTDKKNLYKAQCIHSAFLQLKSGVGQARIMLT